MFPPVEFRLADSYDIYEKPRLPSIQIVSLLQQTPRGSRAVGWEDRCMQLYYLYSYCHTYKCSVTSRPGSNASTPGISARKEFFCFFYVMKIIRAERSPEIRVLLTQQTLFWPEPTRFEQWHCQVPLIVPIRADDTEREGRNACKHFFF